MKIEAEARSYFDQQYNCAQSVFAPFAKRLDLDLDTAFMIATPFGGGLGHSGQVCGAVSGALMAIGLSAGITMYDKEKKDYCYHLASLLQTRFKALHGTVTCPGLLGLDIGNPDELAEVRARDLFNTRCPNFVGDAARLAQEILAIED